MSLHDLSIEEIGKIRRDAEEYLAIWFGFSKDARAKRTPEWVEAASKRLNGQTVYCCECGNEYPEVDLHFGDQVYCENCREE